MLCQDCVKHGMKLNGMEWIGLDSIGLEWNGIDWSGAHFYFEIYFRNNSSPNHSNGEIYRFNVPVCIRCNMHVI